MRRGFSIWIRCPETEKPEVESAGNGAEALKFTANKEYDVMIMDGYQATRLIRGQGYRKPIVALTAHGMAEEKDRTSSAGYDAHLTKPINQGLLVRTVQALTAKARR